VMTTLIFQCPTTGHLVQGWFADHGIEDHRDVYEPITCLASGRARGRAVDRPCLRALRLARCLPDAVRGPVLRTALRLSCESARGADRHTLLIILGLEGSNFGA
jgi:hypothetical protein